MLTTYIFKWKIGMCGMNIFVIIYKMYISF